jgi:hypothetical protein
VLIYLFIYSTYVCFYFIVYSLICHFIYACLSCHLFCLRFHITFKFHILLIYLNNIIYIFIFLVCVLLSLFLIKVSDLHFADTCLFYSSIRYNFRTVLFAFPPFYFSTIDTTAPQHQHSIFLPQTNVTGHYFGCI